MQKSNHISVMKRRKMRDRLAMMSQSKKLRTMSEIQNPKESTILFEVALTHDQSMLYTYHLNILSINNKNVGTIIYLGAHLSKI